ncbi:hypothetical protein [Rathayibacter sp. SD072]|uniref:hypothetical protein n=1 Tax=Rathayibacter sp. SD072 TaxID=2781731 RepID=UPI001A96F333|nr:hypothetical protein [Rathayibacter sp. SD072]MBO0985127.1 hypothetical protein [Rathayibacter sp. SD072]
MTASSSDRALVTPTAASRAATLRLAGILVAAAGLLQIAAWFLPLDLAVTGLGRLGALIAAALLAAAASALARGSDAKGGIAGRTGAAAFLVVAVLIVLRPLVAWFSPSGAEPTRGMAVASALVLVMGAAAIAAAVVGLVALQRARTARTSVTVVGLVAVVAAAAQDYVPSLGLLVDSSPSQELLIALWTIGSFAEALSLVALGAVMLLASRSIGREGR